LARAIDAANAGNPKPQLRDDADESAKLEFDVQSKEWRKSRRAVIHTIDDTPAHTKWAKKIVKDFRHGIYAGNVDFHTADVSNWIATEMQRRGSTEPFLSHAFLDLPSTTAHMATVANALKADGSLIIWNPSITQAVDCVRMVKEQQLPLFWEQTVECIAGQTGGRPWNVATVRTRNRRQSLAGLQREDEMRADEPTEVESNPTDVEDTGDTKHGVAEPDAEFSPNVKLDETADDATDLGSAANGGKLVVSCRPSPFARVVGGGFATVFKKMDQIS
jgi:tRNA (adenine57-N1/adenine58-N1)-methyltransferase catalytic subunit